MNTDAIIHAIDKYYDAGWEIISANITSDDADTALAISNLVESKPHGACVFNITTPAVTPGDGTIVDFTPFLDKFKSNRRTKAVSLPANLDPDSIFGDAFVGEFVDRGVGANAKFMQNMPLVQPQDEYNFTPADLMPYEKYNVSTYAYENGTPMTTNGRMMTGIDFSAIIVSDSIRKDMIDTIGNYLANNKFIPYDNRSIGAITNTADGILKDYEKNELIEDGIVHQNDKPIDDIQKASGVLSAINYEYKPMRSIDNVKMSQTLNITADE